MQIADTLSAEGDTISTATAWRYVKAGLRAQAKSTEKEIDTYRELIAERYNRIYDNLIDDALANPEGRALDKVLTVLAGLRGLYGLDRPVPRDNEVNLTMPTALVINRTYVKGEGE